MLFFDVTGGELLQENLAKQRPLQHPAAVGFTTDDRKRAKSAHVGFILMENRPCFYPDWHINETRWVHGVIGLNQRRLLLIRMEAGN